jgi:hypothetical protein
MPGGYIFARKALRSFADGSSGEPIAGPAAEPAPANAAPASGLNEPAAEPAAGPVNAGTIICSPQRGQFIGWPARPSATSRDARHSLHCSVTVIAYKPNPL